MGKILLTLIGMLLYSVHFYAQRSNVVYAEALGSGIFYSVNFDSRFFAKPSGAGFRFGGNVMQIGDGNLVTFIPGQINFITGGRYGLEIGAGATFSYQKEKDRAGEYFLFPNATLMFRYQHERGLNFRIGVTPLLVPEERDAIFSRQLFLFYPGLSLGYRL